MEIELLALPNLFKSYRMIVVLRPIPMAIWSIKPDSNLRMMAQRANSNICWIAGNGGFLQRILEFFDT